ncbi:hypothetical protein NG895_09085 [Aeoliella sp. ICT_H6.2]|uniref:PEP-CTERM protein-sorting domain-containing protein n=1 Tax=Aeoliella straminimaris TaxID=2954799 RepID=A0A9X2F9J1_9BACT|nr:hypothetical protein [Aeoliella straminimaris]MCO6044062.1 hypothetical protein [Aeoliella straminimaris]
MRTTTLSTAALMACASFCAVASAQSFIGLGELTGGPYSSRASGLSGDGQYVVGSSLITDNETEAFLWTESTGIVDLGMPPGSDTSTANAVSNDGDTVAGFHGANLSATNPARAMLWTTGGGPTDFDPFPANADVRGAGDLSADGTTVVGTYRRGFQGADAAYHWDGSTLTTIEDPNLEDFTNGTSVSADGRVVAGSIAILNFPNPLIRDSFIWTADDGITRLGFLPGATNNSSANGISADGNVVVGSSDNAAGDNEAYRWTEADGMVGLGDLPGGDFDSRAADTTADGSIVVGRSNVLGGFLSSAFDPFIWDETGGMRNLVDVLTDDFGLGSELAGWNLTEATAISDDGRVIVGNGFNPDGNSEAWRAVLVPEPSAAVLGMLALIGLGLLRTSCTRSINPLGKRDAARLSVAFFLVSFGLCAPASAQSFMGLGDLAGGDFQSSALGLSADGQVVTGSSDTTSGLEAFRWSEGTGIVGLGVPAGNDSSVGFSATTDGAIILGRLFPTTGSIVPFTWTDADGIENFDPFPTGAVDKFANDIDSDGNTIVGSYRSASRQPNIAYHWNGGVLTPISNSGVANGVSADGAVVVGKNLVNPNGPLPLIDEAFVWNAADGNVGLGYLPGGSLDSIATSISADGLVVVGRSDSSSGSSEAFRWTLGDGMTGLGDLPGGDFNSAASDASADGRVIVGRGTTADGSTPFIWDASNGMRDLTDVLINDFGLGDELVGWDLGGAEAISNDGRVIIGRGINPDGNFEAWRAVMVPEPSTAILGAVTCLGLLLRRTRREA